MSADPNWTRWIFASVASVLKAVATNANLPVLVEHLDERTASFMQATDRAEIRITGPFVHEPSPNCFTVYVDTNVLLTSRYDGQQKNAYTIHKLAGLFQEAMGSPIPVWNYGSEDGDYLDNDPDSQVQIGCLLPRQNSRDDAVRVFHFGQINTTDKNKQTVVDARFEMYL